MKILGIMSSANVNRNTATLVREALRGAQAEGAEITEIVLSDYKIEFCTGCFACLREGRCPLSDDFDSLKQLLIEADGLILGSPTYAGSMNAMMKRFFERLGMFERFTSEVFGGKYVAGISTAGSMGAGKVAKSLVAFPINGIFKRGYASGTLGAAVGPNPITAQPEVLQKARELGKTVAQDIKTGKTYPLQNMLGRFFTRMMVKPRFRKISIDNKEGRMKGVYSNLQQRCLLS